jgi:hypothetical protein
MNPALNQVRIALAILGAVALAMLLNRFIVTDKRRIERTAQGMADAASKGDIDLLFSFVSADYGDETMSRTHLKALATRFLGGYDHANPKIRWMSVKVVGPLAHVHVGISESGREGYPLWLGTSEWAAEFRKEADGAWRVTKITPVRVWGGNVSSWGDVTRHFERGYQPN